MERLWIDLAAPIRPRKGKTSVEDALWCGLGNPGGTSGKSPSPVDCQVYGRQGVLDGLVVGRWPHEIHCRARIGGSGPRPEGPGP